MKSKIFDYAGVFASVVLIAIGAGAIVMGLSGRSEVGTQLKQEQITGTPDMSPSGIAAEVTAAQKAQDELFAKLHKAGVTFCIRSQGSSNTRNLPYEAAMAVSYGLPPEEGLKAVMAKRKPVWKDR